MQWCVGQPRWLITSALSQQNPPQIIHEQHHTSHVCCAMSSWVVVPDSQDSWWPRRDAECCKNYNEKDVSKNEDDIAKVYTEGESISWRALIPWQTNSWKVSKGSMTMDPPRIEVGARGATVQVQRRWWRQQQPIKTSWQIRIPWSAPCHERTTHMAEIIKTARCRKVPSLGWRWEGASLNGGGTIIVVGYLLSLYLSQWYPSLHADIWIVCSTLSEIGMTQLH